MHPPNSAPARAGSNGPEELPRVGPSDESSVPHPGLVLHAEPLAVDDRGAAVPVSYTHLTLPTIYSV